VIVLGSDGESDREHFKTVDSVGRTYHPYSRRDEHFETFLCRGLNQDTPNSLAESQEVELNCGKQWARGRQLFSCW
jgi:hypothetical protein